MPSLYDDQRQLFEANQDRERLSIDYFIANPIARSYIQQLLGLNAPGVWFATRIFTSFLVPPETARKGLPGDIDLIGGILTPDGDWDAAVADARSKLPDGAHPDRWVELAALGTRPEWPPRLDYLAAMELKAVTLKESGDLRMDGDISHARDQARGLVEMGFDRASLGWLVSSEPVPVAGTNVAQYLASSARTAHGEKRVRQRVSSPQTEKFGEFIFGVGSVPGRSELMSGVLHTPEVLREPTTAAPLSGTFAATIRANVRTVLRNTFSRFPSPANLSVVVLRSCRRGSCGELFLRAPGDVSACPKCGAPAA